ncbi:pentapeptide repeat-containing protein [Rheinheimera riviphila]|uniref:Pentapeptide repeat-containing protein n=1 Tax=Rheinheimera riviphila TaxID=1834037 RepID=A0A437R006_9GAMM|nr:pentapeptide repeat-containing protein [Rheinheimera riviphila]RVU40116.1 pentapeptide repeat-containing protein [Rheinheimera riviphila]
MADAPLCCYQEDDPKHCCHEPAAASGLCYWHDPTICKDQPGDKAALELYAKSGGQLRGLALKRAQLTGLNLAAAPGQPGYDLSFTDLYRANLHGAHLYKANLTEVNLMKADLREANVHWTCMQQANLLGVKWAGARLENMQLGKQLRQEKIAHQADKIRDRALANDYFEQSEEIYRDLRKAAEHEGLFVLSGRYIQQELRMRRFQYPRWSKPRLLSKLIDVFCGYGEEPVRVVLFSLLLIFLCAICYFFLGVVSGGELLQFNPADSFWQQLKLFGTCLYYSVVTFTTLGYGDITPIGWSRLFAAFEAFTGSFTIALFVVVFVKKMTR